MPDITDLLEYELWQEMIDEGYVNAREHPSLPLTILNYSAKTQYEQRWNSVTEQCRGLIYNHDTNRVVARPFRKFWNWDDSRQPYPPSGPVLRMPKMDGSLGVLYRRRPARSGVSVATRGSFTSDQAIWATRHLAREFLLGGIDAGDLHLSKYTYLTEIIFPENRIVVNYGSQQRLVLLDVIDTETGKSDVDEFDRVYWVDKVKREYFPNGFSDSFGHDIPEGEEGFVVYWPGKDYRVKMKSAEYLELHKAIFSLSERSVYEMLTNGQSIAEICEKIPDEFHDWVKDIATRLTTEAERIEADVKKEFNRISKNLKLDSTRKDFAEVAVGSPNKAYLFMMFDGKPIREAIWKTLRPVGSNKAVSVISEDVA